MCLQTLSHKAMGRHNNDERNQDIHMLQTSMAPEQIVHQNTLSRLSVKFTNTGSVKDRPSLVNQGSRLHNITTALLVGFFKIT